MRPNRFLQNAFLGIEFTPLRLLAIGITWFSFLVLGGVGLLIPVFLLMMRDPDAAARYQADPLNFKLLGIDMTVVFVLLMTQFLVGWLGIVVGERLIVKRKVLAVVTGSKRFRWNRMLLGFGVWMSLMVAYQLVSYAADPTSLTFVADWKHWVPYMGIALVLVPLQGAFEEVAVRGQLLQATFRLAPRMAPIFHMVLGSLLFAALHIMNNEVSEYGVGLMMAHYFSFGLVLAIFSVIDEGLELAIGIHAGNNLYSLCIVGYPGASLQTPTLFQQGQMTAWIDFVVMIAFVTLAYFIFFGRRKGALKALSANVGTGPAEPGDALGEESTLPFGE